MNDKTANLGLPYLSENQSQKEVTYNDMTNILDMLIQPCIVSVTNNPPSSPAEGDMYLVGVSPTGAWAGKAHNITSYIGGAWKFITPKEGWRVWNISDKKEYRYLSGLWIG